jgi:hypothetical protein
VDGDQRLACDNERGLVGAAAREVPPHRDDGQETDDADGDDRGLDHASGDVTEGDALVLPPDNGEDRDSGTDVRYHEEHLKERSDEDAGVGAGAQDVVRVAEDWTVEHERGNRCDEGEDEKHAGGERGLSGRVHV